MAAVCTTSRLFPPEAPMKLHAINRGKLVEALQKHLAQSGRPVQGLVLLQVFCNLYDYKFHFPGLLDFQRVSCSLLSGWWRKNSILHRSCGTFPVSSFDDWQSDALLSSSVFQFLWSLVMFIWIIWYWLSALVHSPLSPILSGGAGPTCVELHTFYGYMEDGSNAIDNLSVVTFTSRVNRKPIRKFPHIKGNKGAKKKSLVNQLDLPQ